MVHRSAAAAVRAAIVVACLVAPALIAPPGRTGGADAFLLLAAAAGLLALLEYAARAPSLVELRDAPPYNRLRFAVLALGLVGGALATAEAAPLGALARAAGLAVAEAADVPGSPLRVVLALVPEGASEAALLDLSAAAGLALLAALLGVGGFGLVLRATAWPGPARAINPWVALPTFAGSDRGILIARLRRDGAVNLLLGAAAPYLAPPLAAAVGAAHGVSVLESELVLVWAMASWGFLPATLLLRGLALRRLAARLAARPASGAADAEDGLAAA